MHLPKTSGTALTRGLAEALTPRLAVSGFDRSLFGSFRRFETVSEELLRGIYLDCSKLPNEADFIAGHLALSTLRERYHNSQCMTVLREPQSRLVSHWLYWRAQGDEILGAWGEWAEYVREARQPLANFLACKKLACQLDNLLVRMLLWPHELIPGDDFIDVRNDRVLFRAALARLRSFAFVDLMDNPAFLKNLERWIGRPVAYHLINETPRLPPMLRSFLHDELTPAAFELLADRTRLDRAIWTVIAQERIAAAEVETLRERTLIRNISRHSCLMADG